ncbi:hypothetical protein BZA05DRAFT_384969 [Tricharina praecox]|uniref:uncharacterized protein n=1 Tax=Tricharina praecox TaxID=43433 RepID=UPI0022201AF8|nr:uncharacterized protein BZA05DRAFT_384969 [Tricharina praecox]KAI5857828.1 hypothetical protein BZA05DRAFT_384969 [Tricharina praecox]
MIPDTLTDDFDDGGVFFTLSSYLSTFLRSFTLISFLLTPAIYKGGSDNCFGLMYLFFFCLFF